MIDVENVVIDRIYRAVTEYDDGIDVTSVPTPMPERFPHVTIYESDNEVYRRSQTLDSIENHAVLAYEVNVYTCDREGRKERAKAIADVIDGEMARMRFTRTFRSQTPNVDREIYRITMRYRGIASRPVKAGENEIVRIYSE